MSIPGGTRRKGARIGLWHGVTVLPSTTGKLAVLHHPNTAGFVSLRASATDTARNTVHQTIIRAYRIG